MSSSLEDFIDRDTTDGAGSTTLYLKDMVERAGNRVRTVGQEFTGNVFSQDPR